MNADTLTPDAVLAMPAGEALDALVAMRVLKWRKETYPAIVCDSKTYWMTGSGAFVGTNCRMVSDNLGDAEVVLDWLRGRWGQITIQAGLAWHVFPEERLRGEAWGTADTLPLALCRAALLEVIAEGK